MNPFSPERRAHQRYAVHLLIEYAAKDSFRSDYMADISGGGLFIQTLTPLPVGTEIEFKIAVPSIPKLIEARGIVVRISEQKTNDEPPGMGIKFIGLKEDDARFIDTLTLPET